MVNLILPCKLFTTLPDDKLKTQNFLLPVTSLGIRNVWSNEDLRTPKTEPTLPVKRRPLFCCPKGNVCFVFQASIFKCEWCELFTPDVLRFYSFQKSWLSGKWRRGAATADTLIFWLNHGTTGNQVIISTVQTTPGLWKCCAETSSDYFKSHLCE